MKSIFKRKIMRNKKGFTLAELLIVIGIIAVLAAIAIPTFTSSINKAQIAADKANVRAWYAEKVVEYLTAPETYPDEPPTYGGMELNKGASSVVVSGDSIEKFSVTYTWAPGESITFGG